MNGPDSSSEVATTSGGGPGGLDLQRLRSGRLARLKDAMRRHGVEVLVLCNEPNIRYATGGTAMPVYSMSTFVRCAVVAQEGAPILFEHANSAHRSRIAVADVRPMHAWEFFDDPGTEATVWAHEIAAAIGELGASGRVVAVDRLGTPGFLALQGEGLRIVDSAPVTQEAREVKTPEEIRLLEITAGIVMDMLAAFGALHPGVRERELLALLADTMLRRGGEYLATSTVCSGPNTNPWRAEATDRVVRSGELVYVDTDTVGIEGYFFCVSRTFLSGDDPPTREQRDVFRAAHEWLTEMTALIEPGITCAELAARAPRIPPRYLEQRYECMIHGAGLEEESPSVCHPQDPQSNGDRVLEENMVMVVEIYAGGVGAPEGVKLGDQLRITRSGSSVLAPYPFDAALLA